MKSEKNRINTECEKEATFTAPCKFCGQINVIKWFASYEPDDDDLIEEGTKACKCDEAKWYAEREFKINAAVERIENMLQTPEEVEARKILTNAAAKIYDGNIYSLSINIGNGVKVDMKKGKENTVKIKRQEVETREETV